MAQQQRRWRGLRQLLKLPFYMHLLPFFQLLKLRPLEIADMGTPGELASSKPTVAALHAEFGEEFSKLRDEEHLIRALESAAWDHTTTLAYTFAALNTLFMYAPAFIVRVLTGAVDGTISVPGDVLWTLAALLFVLGTAATVFQSHAMRYIYQYGARKKGALTILILQKLLTLNQVARQELSDGAIVNMMHGDSGAFFRTAPGFMEAFFGAVQLVLGVVLLAFQVGVIPAAASLCVLLVLPIPRYLFKSIASLRRQYMQAEDWRAKLTHEILFNIRAVKLYAWDVAMLEKLVQCRTPELRLIRSIALATALGFMVVVAVAPGIQHASVFYALLLSNGDNTSPSHIITAMAILAVMRGPLYELPSMWAQMTSVRVAAERLVHFFRMPSESSVPASHPSPRADGLVLSCNNASFGWSRSHAAESHSRQAEETVSNVLHAKRTEELHRAVVRDLNLQVHQGQLVGVVGGMGTGKSTLLRGILGEVTLMRGSVDVWGTVAYCAQHPYMPTESVRTCILGGLPFDEQRYTHVLRVCALEDDIRTLPHGDSTIIAGMGRNLSGGQRARIALARAIYRDADVYILDDPLASLDSTIRTFVFQQVFLSFLRGKTVITIIRDQKQLERCDLLVGLQKHAPPFVGTFEEFEVEKFVVEDFGVDVLKDYDELLEQTDAAGWHKNVLQQFTGPASVVPESLTAPLLSQQFSEPMPTFDDIRSTMLLSFAEPLGQPSMASSLARDFTARQSVLEMRATNRMTAIAETSWRQDADAAEPTSGSNSGGVSREVYMEYVRAMGTWSFCGLLAILLVWYLFDAASYFWLIHWTREVYGGDDDDRQYDDFAYIHAYAGLVGFSIVCSAIASTFFPALHTRAAGLLFEKLARSALLGQLSIIERIGGNELLAVLTRFVSEMDLEVPGILYECISTGFVVLVSILGLIYSTTGYALVFIVPVSAMIWRRIDHFKTCTTGMQRIEAKTQVVIYQHYAECLLGAATIRAHRIIPATLAALERHVQMNNFTLSFKTGAVNYFTIRLQAMGSCFCMLLALLALSLRSLHSGSMLFWAAIPICLSMTSNFRSLVRLICAADANMQSIETIVDFYTIPHELDADNGDDTIMDSNWRSRQVSTGSVSRGSTRPGSQLSGSFTTHTNSSSSLSTSRPLSSLASVRFSMKPFWPDKGSVKASGLTVGYGGAPVLRDLSFSIKPMQKIAVVGRTGVGKSTLLSTFFGAADILSGSIVIDGKDIGAVPVRRLRSSLSLIPQTAIVFSLSIRENLDIHGEHSDVRLWDVLDQVGLGDMVRNLPEGLGYSFRTGAGSDLWSTGQKQLLCIARTLLRPSRVIFLDEATSSVDDESDSKIMRVIDDCFAHCTMIACVHRLNNIMMFDRVLVLDKGRMVEFDKPQTLINKEGSVLRELWQAQHRA